MTPIKTLILEDQSDIREDLYEMLTSRPFISVVGQCATVKEALAAISTFKPDLLVLDIELDDGLSFDLLHVAAPKTKIIFVTAYEQYAIKAIKHGVFDYLLKPLDEEELLAAIDKIAESTSEARRCDFLVLASADFYQIVKLDEILYCQSGNGYTTFFLTDGRSILTSQHLKRYEDILPDDKFLKPHKSYLVNYNFIDRYYKDGTLQLKNGIQIPVATRRKENVADFILRFS